MSVGAQRFATLLASLAVAWLSACAGLPPRGPVEHSTAFTDTEATPLGRIAANSTLIGHSGVGLLPTGDSAFGARSALAARAERSLDVQYYHLHADPAGADFVRELHDASERGVRVRLLIDDLHAADTYPLLIGLAAHPGVQVRLFNPLTARKGDKQTRIWRSLHAFSNFNNRMHNKLFIADNAVAIFGGRNIADEYFMRHGEANFVDLDVIAAGPVVQDLSQSFDRYWNSEQAHPLHPLQPPPTDLAQARAAFDQAALGLGGLRQPPADRTRESPITAQLNAGRLELRPANASVHDDPPSKAAGTKRAWTTKAIGRLQQSVTTGDGGEGQSKALLGVFDMLASAQSDVLIVNPYIVPGQGGLLSIRDVVNRGVRVRIYTNSLGSTDEPMVHFAYSRYRVDLLRLGVELYEFSPEVAGRSGRFGDFGKSTARMHTKIAVADGRWLAAGSVNLDSRSAFFNTELTVVLDCAALAEETTQLILGDYQRSMYRLRLAEDGSTIEWLMPDADGGVKVLAEEPHIDRLPTGPEWLKLSVDEDLL